MFDRYAITAELHRRGTSHAAIGRKLGYSRRFIGLVITGDRRNPRVRREIARVIGKPISVIWPKDDDAREAA